MNYQYLLRKYISLPSDTKVIMHDRTYEGLEVIGFEKPSIEQFEAFQREEDRLAEIENRRRDGSSRLLEERQHQAKAKALEEIRPIEDKIREEQEKVRQEILKVKKQAIEIQESLRTKEDLLDCWQEISAAQMAINNEAEQYLCDTDFYVTRMNETGEPIPEEVSKLRTEARSRINRGQLVFRSWDKLRSLEMPSRTEIEEAIRAGGEELKRITALIKDINLKYRKPRSYR